MYELYVFSKSTPVQHGELNIQYKVVVMITISPDVAAGVGCSGSHYFILSLLETGVRFSQLSVRDYSSLLIFLLREQFLHLQQRYMEKRSYVFTKKYNQIQKGFFSPVSFTIKV